MSDENYYKVGGSLEYQHPTYVVRQADSDLYEGLKNGEFCYVLNSRQMGKSSLRVQMMKKLKEQGVKCASIDMTRIGSHVTPQEWYAGIVSELLRGFSLSRKVNFSSWWRERELLPPLQRLRELIEDVLLTEFSQNLVIFIDEIDSIIKIQFKEDFFAFIRACYNQRVDNSEYNRLTFCLLGVATPSDLITDKNVSTPFNIGRAIELTGFQLHEAMPLAQGLQGLASNPQVVIREVLAWTGGQPFLTQKVCKLVLSAEEMIPDGNEAVWVENVVRSRLIENWETQDEPEHLRTIRDRIIWSQRKGQLLLLYEQILQTSLAPPYQGGDGGVKANDKPEHMELRLSGLVVKQQGKLRVYNRIYGSIFNQSWVENALAEAGLEPEVAETLAPSKAEIQSLEQAALEALQQFEYQQIEALLSAMQAGQQLQALVGDDCLLQDYPTVMPLYALQSILDQIREQNQFIGHQDNVWSVNFSPRGEYIATASADATVRLWDLSGNQIAKFQHQGEVFSVCFSPNEEYIATVLADGTAWLWDFSGNQVVEFKGHHSEVYSVSFSPNEKYVATASVDGTAQLWDLSGNQIVEFKGHQEPVYSVCFSPDGDYLATTSADGSTRLWDLSGTQISEFKGHQRRVYSVSFSPNGKYLATASADNTARLWLLSGRKIAKFQHKSWVRSVSFSPDGAYIATASDDGTACLWDLLGNQIAQFRHRGWVRSVSFSPDGQYLATASSDSKARLWNLSQKHLVQWKGHQGVVWSLSFSPDGQCLASAGADGTARLWNLSGQPLAQLNSHRGWVTQVSFSLDGQCLVTTGDDGMIRLWNLSGQQLYQWQSYQGEVWNISFSPDGQYIVTAGDDGTIKLWNVSGQLLNQWKVHQRWLNYVSFSPDGQYITTTSDDGRIIFWNLSGQQLNQGQEHQERVWSVIFKGLALSFSPDEKRVATGGRDGTIKLGQVEGLDELLVRGCNWLKDYFVTHPEALEKLEVCQNRFNSIEADSTLARVDKVEDGSTQLKNSAQISNPTSNRILWVKASKLAPAPTSVAPRRFVITVSKDSEEGFLGEFLVRDKLVRIYQGDITNLVTDVIVSSDDNYLTMGGGVSARIRQVGGENIYREARNLIPLSLGEVAVTTAGKLRARKLFHAVVIDFYEGEKLSDKVIQRVVHSCMKKASLYDFRSIAFPLLGTGAAGFPAKVVWEIMFRQIIRDLSAENQNISEVIVAIYQRRIVEELKIKNFLEAIEECGWTSLL
jgi:WD40 repeat protein